MTRVAYLRGAWVPESQAVLPVTDLGVVGGIAVSEMLRTFQHEAFRVAEHLDRFQQSLHLAGLSRAVADIDLTSLVEELVRRNTAELPAEDDLGIIIAATAGGNPTYLGRHEPTVAVPTLFAHTFSLQYGQWARRYETGVSLRTSRIQALHASCVDRRIKSRSRLHWHLADLDVKAIDPEATAILLDEQGHLTETAAANLCILRDGVLISPPEGDVLEGISLGTVLDLCRDLGWTCQRQRISPRDLATATEAFLTSTPSCLLPATRFDGSLIGTGRPGPGFDQLVAAWKSLAGVDFVQQALHWSGVRG